MFCSNKEVINDTTPVTSDAEVTSHTKLVTSASFVTNE